MDISSSKIVRPTTVEKCLPICFAVATWNSVAFTSPRKHSPKKKSLSSRKYFFFFFQLEKIPEIGHFSDKDEKAAALVSYRSCLDFNFFTASMLWTQSVMK